MTFAFAQYKNEWRDKEGYKEGEIVKPLCIILPQMTGYIKYFENGEKNMSFAIKDDYVLDKYNEIWDKIKETLNIKFHSMPGYDEKYIKAKVRKINGAIKTNFLGDKISKENKDYTYIACVIIDSVVRIEKKKLSTGLFRRMHIQNKKIKNDQIHKSRTKIRVRVRVRIWHWIIVILF